MKVLVVTPESRIRREDIGKGEDALAAMQKLVGGYIEHAYPVHVKLPQHFMMVVNEEGHIHNLPINPIASRMYGGPIAGTAVFVKEGIINKMQERDWIDCSEEEMDHLIRMVASVGLIIGVAVH